MSGSLEIEIEELLSFGSFGKVHKGRCSDLNVVAKIFIPSSDNQNKDIYKLADEEAQLHRKLRHKHIIQFYDFVQYKTSRIILSEYAELGNLSSLLENRNIPLNWETRKRFAKEIASAVSYLHFKDIIHRKLKSSNILITKCMEIKLGDFELCQSENNKIDTNTDDRLHLDKITRMIPWMAPELFKNEPEYTKKSDIYAYGTVLWEIAAKCSKPYKDHSNPYTLVAFILANDGRETIPEDTPIDISELISQCWSKDASKRPLAADILEKFKNININDENSFSDLCSDCESTVSICATIIETNPPNEKDDDEDFNLDDKKSKYNISVSENSQLIGDTGNKMSSHWLFKEGLSYWDGGWNPIKNQNQKPDFIKAIHYFQQSADQYHTSAIRIINRVYEFGDDIRQRYENYLDFYPATAMSQIYGLAESYCHGKNNLRQDYGKATYWYKKLVEYDYPYANLSLGMLYMGGDAVEKCYKTALQYYNKAANRGVSDAQYRIGIIYLKGIGVDKDTQKALNWLEKAANLGHPKAQSELGTYYLEGISAPCDYPRAIQFSQKAADQGDVQGQVNLARIYLYGHGVEKDYDKAFNLGNPLAKDGNACAQYNLGEMYENGFGCQQDYEEAAEWYTKSADQGYAPGQYKLALMCIDGKGVTKNETLAMDWLYKAADQNYPESEFYLGTMYEEGKGVEKDLKKAREWFEKCVARKNYNAQYSVDKAREKTGKYSKRTRKPSSRSRI